MRDAPSIPLVNSLIEQGAVISAYDPVATENARKLIKGAEFVKNPYEAAKDADALVVVTEWDEFRALDLDRFAAVMAGKLIVDLRNVYNRSDAEEAGFDYIGLGRGRIDGGPRLKLVKNGPEAAAR
jgi:UDPglucose 6-dehydrogenase